MEVGFNADVINANTKSHFLFSPKNYSRKLQPFIFVLTIQTRTKDRFGSPHCGNPDSRKEHDKLQNVPEIPDLTLMDGKVCFKNEILLFAATETVSWIALYWFLWFLLSSRLQSLTMLCNCLLQCPTMIEKQNLWDEINKYWMFVHFSLQLLGIHRAGVPGT